MNFSIILKIPGADVNVKDCDGWTPLHAAVHWGSKSACEVLTDFGADFEIMNNNVSYVYCATGLTLLRRCFWCIVCFYSFVFV